MSLSGKIPHVFSGEDDHPVVLSLPLAFLRLIASGVYTYEIDWRNEEWEPDEPTSDQLAIVEGALTAVTVAAGGVSLECEQMQTIEQINWVLVAIHTYTQTGQVFTINHSMLPAAAQGATGLYCRFHISHSSANQVIEAKKKSGFAAVYFSTTAVSFAERHMVIVPMDEDGAEIKSYAPNGTTITLGVFLVGWWK